jgi:hypothetical protein
MFVILEFKKTAQATTTLSVEDTASLLQPCIYKRR